MLTELSNEVECPGMPMEVKLVTDINGSLMLFPLHGLILFGIYLSSLTVCTDNRYNSHFMRLFAAAMSRPCQEVGWAIDTLREHFGERCAFYFAFSSFYTKSLGVLVVLSLLLYLCVRTWSWSAYISILAVYGFFIPSIWGPLMAKLWRRKNVAYCHQWNMDTSIADRCERS
jgi:hypothetical protein